MHESYNGAVGEQVVRRILANVPATAQALCTSPFLDANLFSYDDKLISTTLKMRGYTEQPLKFVSRAHPAASRFKVRVCSIHMPQSVLFGLVVENRGARAYGCMPGGQFR